jgi:hypothetical protein
MTSVANANRALEESKKEINSQKVEIEHLKLRLEQAPRVRSNKLHVSWSFSSPEHF